MNDLRGKKILLISLSEYSKGLIDEMVSLGGNVDYFCDKPNNGVVCKTLGRLKFKPYMHVFDNYYDMRIKERMHKQYDYVLCIRGEYTPISALKSIKKSFPNAKLILYMWDSIRNNKGIGKKWEYYDKIFTFDRIDYLNNKTVIQFLPLFYFNKYVPNDIGSYKYDLAFIGTGHEDRVKIIKGIKTECIQKN